MYSFTKYLEELATNKVGTKNFEEEHKNCIDLKNVPSSGLVILLMRHFSEMFLGENGSISENFTVEVAAELDNRIKKTSN